MYFRKLTFSLSVSLSTLKIFYNMVVMSTSWRSWHISYIFMCVEHKAVLRVLEKGIAKIKMAELRNFQIWLWCTVLNTWKHDVFYDLILSVFLSVFSCITYLLFAWNGIFDRTFSDSNVRMSFLNLNVKKPLEIFVKLKKCFPSAFVDI